MKQWVYKPTKLNGQAVEVDTQITVVFTLGNDKPAAPPAQPPASPSPTPAPEWQPLAQPPIDPQLKSDLAHFLELTHFNARYQIALHDLFESMRPELQSKMPPTPNRAKILDELFEKLTAVWRSPEYEELRINIYAKYPSDDDVKALTRFFETPLGQRYLDVAPKMALEITQFTRRLFAEKIDEIFKQLCTKYPELQSNPGTCPPAPP